MYRLGMLSGGSPSCSVRSTFTFKNGRPWANAARVEWLNRLVNRDHAIIQTGCAIHHLNN
jgi:hypothetical protein